MLDQCLRMLRNHEPELLMPTTIELPTLKTAESIFDANESVKTAMFSVIEGISSGLGPTFDSTIVDADTKAKLAVLKTKGQINNISTMLNSSRYLKSIRNEKFEEIIQSMANIVAVVTFQTTKYMIKHPSNMVTDDVLQSYGISRAEYETILNTTNGISERRKNGIMAMYTALMQANGMDTSANESSDSSGHETQTSSGSMTFAGNLVQHADD